MKRSLLAIVALTAALAFSGPATAAPSPSQQIKALAKRVTALEKKVKTLETENRSLRNIAVGTLAFSICSTAVTADALQGQLGRGWWPKCPQDSLASRPQPGPGCTKPRVLSHASPPR